MHFNRTGAEGGMFVVLNGLRSEFNPLFLKSKLSLEWNLQQLNRLERNQMDQVRIGVIGVGGRGGIARYWHQPKGN
jgi:hypothetical protein